MALLTVQNLIFALVIIVPGFIATIIAVSIGVIQREISSWRLLIVSIASSLLVDSVFLGILEGLGQQIRSPRDVQAVFFTPNFRLEYVLTLLCVSVGVGLVYSIGLAMDLPHRMRSKLWGYFGGKRHRTPWQPWEGTLDDAARVQITTTDGAIAVGRLKEYSDAGAEKQIALDSPDWYDPDEDEFKYYGTDVELFLEKDIQQVTIVDLESDVKEDDARF